MVEELEIHGLLYKKRGGFGRFVPNAWQYRFFTISKDGILHYYDTDFPEPNNILDNKPRGRLDLKAQGLEIVKNAAVDNAPSPFTIQLVPSSNGDETWKLCADTKELSQKWCDVMEKFIMRSETKTTTEFASPSRATSEQHSFSSPSPQQPAVPPANNKTEAANAKAVPAVSTSPTPANAPAVASAASAASTGAGKSAPVAAPAAAAQTAAAPAASHHKKAKRSLKVQTKNDNPDFMESLFCVLIVNFCCLFLFRTSSWLMRLIYFGTANTVLYSTMQLRSERVKKLQSEVDSLKEVVATQTAKISEIQSASVGTNGSSEVSGVVSAVAAVEEEQAPVYNSSNKPAAGITLQQVTTPPMQSPDHTWCVCDHRMFHVRIGPDYNRYKKKAPSAAPLYEAFAVDVFCTKLRIDHVATRFQLPDTSNINTNHPHVPAIMVVQLQMPSEPPPSLLKTVEDGPGWAIVMYFKITEDTLNQLKDIKTASPAVKLFAKYCELGPTDPQWRARFKVICSCLNLEQLGMPSMITSYNAKPVLIRRTGTLFRGTESSYMEFDIHVHKFANLAKQSIHAITSRCNLMYMQIGFVIEGRDDSELPEALFACVGVNRPQEDRAEFLFDD